MFPQRKKLLTLDIASGNYQKFIDNLIFLAKSKNSSYICVANVHMLVEAYRDKFFAEVVNRADIVVPDGMPLAKGMQLLYGEQQDRVAGMDLLPDLLRESEKEGLPVYFYGGTQEMLNATETFCYLKYPDLKLAGLHSPPFRNLSATESDDIVRKINDSKARFVFVALGCPKQEKWMASMKGRVNACMIGIGGALPVMIGMQKRAPEWMQEASLEWLYRLLQEPKRLFKRYFYTNTLFLYLFSKEYFKIKFKLTNS